MRAITTASLAFAALGAASALASARADNATLSVRNTEGLPLYTSNIRDHGVNCVGTGCVVAPDGSIDTQASYHATVRAQSHPQGQ